MNTVNRSRIKPNTDKYHRKIIGNFRGQSLFRLKGEDLILWDMVISEGLDAIILTVGTREKTEKLPLIIEEGKVTKWIQER